MSDSYCNFAYAYDKFMDNIPYDAWSCYLNKLLRKYNICSGTLVELGCGTGTLCQKMFQFGYSIIGIDNSVDMLTIAADKFSDNNKITFLLQDMREFELPDTCHAIYSLCDSLNYLLSPEDVTDTFIQVKQHLKPNGVFIFDLKTFFFYQTILGDQTFCDHQKDCSYTWENNFFEEDSINQYDLTLFIRDSSSNLFQKFTEVHHQRAYTLEEMIDFLTKAGLEYVTAYDAFTENPPTDTSERIYIIARNGEK